MANWTQQLREAYQNMSNQPSELNEKLDIFGLRKRRVQAAAKGKVAQGEKLIDVAAHSSSVQHPIDPDGVIGIGSAMRRAGENALRRLGSLGEEKGEETKPDFSQDDILGANALARADAAHRGTPLTPEMIRLAKTELARRAKQKGEVAAENLGRPRTIHPEPL